MKSLYLPFIVVSCKEATNKKIDTKVSKGDSITKQVLQVAEFTGQQVTGVTVTSTERIFVNFPRWRKELKIQ
jgi:hypothetical protein